VCVCVVCMPLRSRRNAVYTYPQASGPLRDLRAQWAETSTDNAWTAGSRARFSAPAMAGTWKENGSQHSVCRLAGQRAGSVHLVEKLCSFYLLSDRKLY
jgi:hypothetical protein